MRALPSLQDARRQPGQHDLLTCDTCMEHFPYELRQTMRCGFIPADRLVGRGGWQPETFDLEVCAGYTTALPDVIDIASNYCHWETGQLAMACDGEQPPKSLIVGMSILKGAIGEFEAHQMRKVNEKRGGG